MTTEEKEKSEVNKAFIKSQSIIETTYEKVLSIINKVKEFIKKSSSESNTLIEDLEWVIKVITNKSLYTYELKQQKLSKQNAEYNKFISFVTKYNEEVIEMNKKHDIVSGILSIGKKGDIILKPSLCLNKILPDELQNIDQQDITEKRKRQNSFITVFGNHILNLYKSQKKQKRININSEEEEINENNNDNNKNNNEYLNNNVNENNKEESINNDNNNKNNNIEKEKGMNRLKSEDLLDSDNRNNYHIKKNNTDENNFDKNDIFNEPKYKLSEKKNNNIQRIKVLSEKDKKNEFDSKFKIKTNNQNLYFNFSHKKKFNIGTKLTKGEKVTFNNIKKAMRSYYVKYAYNDLQWPNLQQYSLKNNHYINKGNFYKTNYYFNDTGKKYKEKAFMLYKNNSTFPLNMISKSKKKDKINKKSNDIYYFKNHKIAKNLKNNLILESNEDRYDIINYENNKTNHNKHHRLQLSKRLQPEDKNNNSFIKESNMYNIKTKYISSQRHYNEYNNTNKEDNYNENVKQGNNNNEEKENIQKETHNYIISVKSLVDNNFNDVKMVTDKDFNIFELKEKMGYKNVLPMMGYVILKTLGLIDSKIISTRKLDSFLITVSNSYKETTLYHNSLHGADVTQSLCVFFLNSNAEEICETTVLDLLGMMVSALGHDLGHPGLNNNYLINASHELAINYNDASCLENFHTSFLFKILRKEENNILEKLSVQNYKTIRKRMISQILATDMVYHGEIISLIRSKIKAWQEEGQSRFNLLTGNEKTKFDEQQLLLNYLIHMADLGHNCKKFEISQQWIKLLCEEFWKQGDKEKAKRLPISFMCDRDNIDVPASQVGFLKGFILSSFDCLVSMFPKLNYTIENAENNIKRWKKLQDEKRLLGWTPEKEKKDNDNENNNDKKE